MMKSTKNNSIVRIVTFLFFGLALIEVISEFYIYKPLILVFKPLIPLALILLYVIESKKRDLLFVIIMSLSLLTNLLFIPDTTICLFYALIVFTIHRILIVYLIFKLNKIKDTVPIVIATAPFLIVFFYLFFETPFIPDNSFALLILQNLLISLFAGISLSSYVMNDNKQNSILLISALLFVMLQFVIFIEKYYLKNEYQEVLRPLAMTLNALAFFSFYKYVIEAEKLNDN